MKIDLQAMRAAGFHVDIDNKDMLEIRGAHRDEEIEENLQHLYQLMKTTYGVNKAQLEDEFILFQNRVEALYIWEQIKEVMAEGQ